MIKKVVIWIYEALRDFWKEFTSKPEGYEYYIIFKNNVLDNLDKAEIKESIKEFGSFSTYGNSGYKGTSLLEEDSIKSKLITRFNLKLNDIVVTRAQNYLTFIR
jgi:hypothetical protein